MQCPQCTSEQIVKNGSMHHGKPKYRCKDCRRQFVEDPQDRRISDATKALIDKLLVGKASGQTSPIERLNNTLRQRISRLVRKTLSFSKKVENYIGAMWYFVHHYNASLA